MKHSLFFGRAFGVLGFIAGLCGAGTALGYDNMVVFGDSLSDNGNLSLAIGPGIFPALDYDPLRATDGPTTIPSSSIAGVTVEQLNAMLGLPALTPAILGGNDYAWGRATTGFTSLDLLAGVSPGTGTQVAAYLTTHPAVSSNSLFVLWAGSNDLIDASDPAGIQDAETAAMANLQSELAALLAAGAKNILWFDLPDLSLTPTGQAAGSLMSAQLHASSLQFQMDWAVTLQQLKFLYPSASVTGVDVYAFMNSLVAHPEVYGLTDVSNPAQGLVDVNPDQYLFWDTLHPTTRGHELLADFAFQQVQVPPVPEPSGSVAAVIALLGVVAQRYLSIRKKR